MTEKELIIKLDFFDPFSISAFSDPDLLKIEVLKNAFFMS